MEPVVLPEGEKAAARANVPVETRHAASPLNRRLLGFTLFSAALVAAFSGILVSLAIHAARSQLHSYIVLIPLVSAYLLFIRRSQLPNSYRSSPGWSTLLLVIGVTALIAAFVPGLFPQPLSQNDYLGLMTVSFLSLLAAAGFFFSVMSGWRRQLSHSRS